MGAMRLLNQTGDVTIGWSPEQNEMMAELIRKKMDQGVRFFIVQPFGDERTQINHIQDIRGHEVVVGDDDIDKLFGEGRIGFFGRIKAGLEIVRRTLDPREAAREHTLAVRQPVGG